MTYLESGGNSEEDRECNGRTALRDLKQFVRKWRTTQKDRTGTPRREQHVWGGHFKRVFLNRNLHLHPLLTCWGLKKTLHDTWRLSAITTARRLPGIAAWWELNPTWHRTPITNCPSHPPAYPYAQRVHVLCNAFSILTGFRLSCVFRLSQNDSWQLFAFIGLNIEGPEWVTGEETWHMPPSDHLKSSVNASSWPLQEPFA